MRENDIWNGEVRRVNVGRKKEQESRKRDIGVRYKETKIMQKSKEASKIMSLLKSIFIWMQRSP